MHSLVEIYRNSGRPSREVFTGSYEECCEELDSLCGGNHILESNYVIVEGSLDDNTYTDERGFIQWK